MVRETVVNPRKWINSTVEFDELCLNIDARDYSEPITSFMIICSIRPSLIGCPRA